MKPTNNKSLLHFLFQTMEKLESREIDVDTAKAQANLAKQANNSLRYELERATLQLKINEASGIIDKNLKIREIELTNPEA
jgi:hypothetical protein